MYIKTLIHLKLWKDQIDYSNFPYCSMHLPQRIDPSFVLVDFGKELLANKCHYYHLPSFPVISSTPSSFSLHSYSFINLS